MNATVNLCIFGVAVKNDSIRSIAQFDKIYRRSTKDQTPPFCGLWSTPGSLEPGSASQQTEQLHRLGIRAVLPTKSSRINTSSCEVSYVNTEATMNTQSIQSDAFRRAALKSESYRI